MKIILDETFHIYNQGNNQENIFYEHADYIQFLKLVKKFVLPKCKVLAYCLMPNHFHFLIHATEESVKAKKIGNIESCELSNGFRLMESLYAQYLNKKKGRSGSLFRQRTKTKAIMDGDKNYGIIAFHYIHQNPLKGILVNRLEDWGYSSFKDYAGLRKDTICDQELAFQLIGFDKINFYKDTLQDIDPKLLQNIFIEKLK